MRGGIYLNNYTLDSHDFKDFVNLTNKKVSNKLKATLNALPKTISNTDLIRLAENNRQC